MWPGGRVDTEVAEVLDGALTANKRQVEGERALNGLLCGQGRDRTGDLPLFRRTLVPTELPGRKALLPPSASPQKMATLTGLEPATSAVTGRRANQLRHRALLYCAVLPAPRAAVRVPPTGFEPALPP